MTSNRPLISESSFGPLLARFRHYSISKQIALSRGLAYGATWRFRGLSSGWPVVEPGVRLRRRNAVVEFGHLCKISRGVFLSANGRSPEAPAELRIGAQTRIWDFSRIAARTSITIGANCAISWNCTILDSDMHSISYDGQHWEDDTAPIAIADDVWIGCNAVILKNVTIGRGAVVAAGSVVTRDVPPHTLVAGVPAKPIREVAAWK